MEIMCWQPSTELTNLRQAMNRLFENTFATPTRLYNVFSLDKSIPINMYHTDNELIVKAILPGVKAKEVDTTITGNTLSIKGEAKSTEEIKRENYLYREHRHGTFHRSITLPSGLNTDKAEASFDDGVLTLTIPKSAQVKPKSIKVKAKNIIEDKK